jgi:hypothetical protein
MYVPDTTSSVHFVAHVGPASDLELSDGSCDVQEEAPELPGTAASPVPWSSELSAIPERSLLDLPIEDKPSVGEQNRRSSFQDVALDSDAVVVTVDQVR